MSPEGRGSARGGVHVRLRMRGIYIYILHRGKRQMSPEGRGLSYSKNSTHSSVRTLMRRSVCTQSSRFENNSFHDLEPAIIVRTDHQGHLEHNRALCIFDCVEMVR